jgi:hypothetical protein
MKARIFGLVAGLAATAAVATGSTLPSVVSAAVQEMASMCKDAEGTPRTEKAVQRADLSGDGTADFIFYVGWMWCDGAASLYGDREKAVTVYVADAKGNATVAFSEMVYDAKVEGQGTAAKLWLTVSGAACGKKPAADFASENFCDRAIVWNAKTKRFDYAPVSTVRMIQ